MSDLLQNFSVKSNGPYVADTILIVAHKENRFAIRMKFERVNFAGRKWVLTVSGRPPSIGIVAANSLGTKK